MKLGGKMRGKIWREVFLEFSWSALYLTPHLGKVFRYIQASTLPLGCANPSLYLSSPLFMFFFRNSFAQHCPHIWCANSIVLTSPYFCCSIKPKSPKIYSTIDKLDDEIAALEKLDIDDFEVLRERRLQQMKKMAEKRSRWISLGHGDYSEIPNEKEFFSVVKANERVVCHFYRDNWPCKVIKGTFCFIIIAMRRGKMFFFLWMCCLHHFHRHCSVNLLNQISPFI